MSDLRDYVDSLTESDLRLMFGAVFDNHLVGMYQWLARFLEPSEDDPWWNTAVSHKSPSGDLLLLFKHDAKLLRRGEVVYRLSDTVKGEDMWRREGSAFELSDAYQQQSILRLYRYYFPLIVQRDSFIQQYARILDDDPEQIILKITPRR